MLRIIIFLLLMFLILPATTKAANKVGATVYFKDGSVERGELVWVSDNKVSLRKNGNLLEFDKDEVLLDKTIKSNKLDKNIVEAPQKLDHSTADTTTKKVPINNQKKTISKSNHKTTAIFKSDKQMAKTTSYNIEDDCPKDNRYLSVKVKKITESPATDLGNLTNNNREILKDKLNIVRNNIKYLSKIRDIYAARDPKGDWKVLSTPIYFLIMEIDKGSLFNAAGHERGLEGLVHLESKITNILYPPERERNYGDSSPSRKEFYAPNSKNCSDGCTSVYGFRIGSKDYNDCVYSCTH